MSELEGPARYAIYYAPAQDSPWWRFGAEWLGRDDVRGTALPQPVLAQLGQGKLERITAEPRRYSFHATLKAPFRLHAEATADELEERMQFLARTLRPVPLGVLVPVFMDGFVALVPSRVIPAVGTLAETCVAELDDRRAPITKADLERRRSELLDERGRELLERFGYPHVMERFRFHMTLTGRVDTELAGTVVAHVALPLARLNAQTPPVLDRLCLFVESSPGAPFRRVAEAILAA